MVIEMYECEHCGYKDYNGRYVEEHEKDCSQNPANKKRYSYMKQLIRLK